jgi:hypothetical protein
VTILRAIIIQPDTQTDPDLVIIRFRKIGFVRCKYSNKKIKLVMMLWVARIKPDI